MKEIKVSQGFIALVDDDHFEVLNQFKWHIKKCGRTNYATANIKIDGKYKTITMHRFLLDAPKGVQVDHINHNGLDNQRDNLRFCSNSQNQMNRSPYKNCTSNFKGVSFYRKTKRWKAYIKLNGKRINLGHYKTEIEAAEVYNNKAKELFGEFSFINIIK
jgi:hypothetical protein